MIGLRFIPLEGPDGSFSVIAGRRSIGTIRHGRDGWSATGTDGLLLAVGCADRTSAVESLLVRIGAW